MYILYTCAESPKRQGTAGYDTGAMVTTRIFGCYDTNTTNDWIQDAVQEREKRILVGDITSRVLQFSRQYFKTALLHVSGEVIW